MEPAEQLTALRERRIHLGIFPDLGAPRDQRFDSRPIFSCTMVAVLPPRHELASDCAELDVNALTKEMVLIPSSEAAGYHECFAQLSASASFTPAATQEVIGVENILGMVAAGYGVAIFPEVLVSRTDCGYKVRPASRAGVAVLLEPALAARHSFACAARFPEGRRGVGRNHSTSQTPGGPTPCEAEDKRAEISSRHHLPASPTLSRSGGALDYRCLSPARGIPRNPRGHSEAEHQLAPWRQFISDRYGSPNL